MFAVRPLSQVSATGPFLLAVVALALLSGAVAPMTPLAGPTSLSPGSSPLPNSHSRPPAELLVSDSATSVEEVGPAPSEGVVGVPIPFEWQALGSGGSRVTSFAVGCELAVTDRTNGSSVRAWVNASEAGSLSRSANGTASVPATAWRGGVLNVTISFATAVPVTVRLFGPLLPTGPAPAALSVRPDLDHLVLFEPGISALGNRSDDTFWHVRDRFGDPTPGAFLIVQFSNATSDVQTVVPVNWTAGGTTGAWVNFSAPGSGSGSFQLTDASNTTLIGPILVPALGSSTPPPTPSLSVLVLVAIVALVLGAVVGMAGLILGGRTRPPPAPSDGEEELRRLAEGRETVVELIRRAGSLGLAEIEASWETSPVPPAVADWVASLVTDGTLTASLGEGGRARFAVAEHPVEEPKVTFDESALEREIARRDAAVDDPGEKPPG